MSNRIKKIFLNNEKKLVTFITGGDPNIKLSKKILKTISENGADIIEIGMPFSDPMADGPIIQLSSNRAIKKGINMDTIFSLCSDFRKNNNHIPIILMGYYNTIFNYGLKKFVKACDSNGVDGLIVVDLQPEEDKSLISIVNSTSLSLIRLITPTTDTNRLKTILKNSSGFLYYVTITGITGQKSADINELTRSIKKIKKHTELPIVCGFGIKSIKQVKEICNSSDGVVVGSSIINIIEKNLQNSDKMLSKIKKYISDLKKGTKI